jgi:hypothetical protein
MRKADATLTSVATANTNIRTESASGQTGISWRMAEIAPTYNIE